jgi:hypothetical protein
MLASLPSFGNRCRYIPAAPESASEGRQGEMTGDFARLIW